MRRLFRIIVFSVVLVFSFLMLRLLFVDELDDFPTTYAYTQAELLPSQDTVEINQGLFWQQITQPVQIEAGTQVRTDELGVAQIIFADDSVLMIEPDTLITIEEHTVSATETHIRIFQEIGKTWSQVKKLLNPKSSYEIETQTTVATVRGTAFGVSVDENQTVDYIVAEGQIEAQVVERVGSKRKSLAQALVNSNQKIHWEKPQLEEGELAMIEFSPEPMELDQELRKWKEETQVKLKELEPVLTKVKQKRDQEREQVLEERKKNRSVIEKWRQNIRKKLGLNSRSQPSELKKLLPNSLEKIPTVSPSPTTTDQTQLPGLVPEPILVSPIPNSQAVQGVFTQIDYREEIVPSPEIINYDHEDKYSIQELDQLKKYDQLDTYEQFDTINKTGDHTFFEQTFEFVE